MALYLPTLAGGGAEQVMINLANGFSNLGIAVDLVLVRAEGVFHDKIGPGVRVIDLNARRMSASFSPLVRYLRDEEPDALLAALGLADFFAVLAKRIARAKTKVVVSVHNMFSRYDRRTIKKKLESSFISWSFRWADGIVAVSHGVAKDLSRTSQVPIGRIKVIYNPIVTPRLIENLGRHVEHPFFQTNQPPVILGVGRLTKQKDFITLIRAFSIVRQSQPARLIILGEGEERAELETLVSELGLNTDVSMPGFVENPYAYMRQAAVFVLSSAWEGLANVLVEALASGCPVVSTNCESGPAEILKDGKYGYLTPVLDSEKMAQAILEVLSGKPKKVESDWLDRFTLECAVNQYLEILGLSS